MAREFDVTTETSASVAQVFTAFGDSDYWLARLAAYGGDSVKLDSLIVEPDGAVSVATSQDLANDILPGPLARALPSSMKIVRTESWRPVGDKVLGEVGLTATGIAGSAVGTASLKPAGVGCSLRLSGTLEVKILLVGGRIEKFIADAIVKEVPEMQRFTTNWIAEHG